MSSPVSVLEIAVVHAQLSLCVGPLSRAEIASRTGLRDRTIRSAVAELISRGEPIVTGGPGYELTRDRARLEGEVLRLRAQATRILQRAQALERHLS